MFWPSNSVSSKLTAAFQCFGGVRRDSKVLGAAELVSGVNSVNMAVSDNHLFGCRRVACGGGCQNYTPPTRSVACGRTEEASTLELFKTYNITNVIYIYIYIYLVLYIVRGKAIVFCTQTKRWWIAKICWNNILTFQAEPSDSNAKTAPSLWPCMLYMQLIPPPRQIFWCY